jgi:hypothetical protein
MPLILAPHMDHTDDEEEYTDERRDHEGLRRAAR